MRGYESGLRDVVLWSRDHKYHHVEYHHHFGGIYHRVTRDTFHKRTTCTFGADELAKKKTKKPSPSQSCRAHVVGKPWQGEGIGGEMISGLSMGGARDRTVEAVADAHRLV